MPIRAVMARKDVGHLHARIVLRPDSRAWRARRAGGEALLGPRSSGSTLATGDGAGEPSWERLGYASSRDGNGPYRPSSAPPGAVPGPLCWVASEGERAVPRPSGKARSRSWGMTAHAARPLTWQ